MDALEFISEFQRLYRESPNISHWTRQTENCDYGDIIVVSKDSYLCFWSSNLEKCFYLSESRRCLLCADCMFCEDCELCYECIDSIKCYNGNYLQDCRQCVDCSFCYGCIGCFDSFGCVGLIRKKYHIFNEPYSEEAYNKKISELKRLPLETVSQRFEELKRKVPRVYMHQQDNQNCFGDYVFHSKNCYWCFDSTLCEDSLYIFNANLERGTKDCTDCGPIANTIEQCYDCVFVGFLFNCKHIYWCDYLSDCEWCINLWNSRHCYGTIYAKHKEYLFLNKPVSKGEYEKVTKQLDRELTKLGVHDLYGLIHYPLS